MPYKDLRAWRAAEWVGEAVDGSSSGTADFIARSARCWCSSDYAAAVAACETPWPAEDLLDRVELNERGVFRYSNVGYYLIRRALEDAYGGTYFEVIARVVLNPLGIEAFSFAIRTDWRPRVSTVVPDVAAYDPGWVYAGTFAATIESTAQGHRPTDRGRRSPPSPLETVGGEAFR